MRRPLVLYNDINEFLSLLLLAEYLFDRDSDEPDTSHTRFGIGVSGFVDDAEVLVIREGDA